MQKQSIQEMLGFPSAKVRMAKTEIYIRPCTADIENAKKSDAANCAYAEAAKRTYGLKSARFFRAVAYLPLDFRGKTVVTKFMLDKEARRNIRQFDETGVMPTTGITLRPVTDNSLKSHGARKNPRSGRGPYKKGNGTPEGEFKSLRPSATGLYIMGLK